MYIWKNVISLLQYAVDNDPRGAKTYSKKLFKIRIEKML